MIERERGAELDTRHLENQRAAQLTDDHIVPAVDTPASAPHGLCVDAQARLDDLSDVVAQSLELEDTHGSDVADDFRRAVIRSRVHAATPVPEFRVCWRYEGRNEQSRIYQRVGNARAKVERLRNGEAPGRRLVELRVEQRLVEPTWSLHEALTNHRLGDQ